MLHLTIKSSIADFQRVSLQIYGLPDDRFFSISDLVSNMERFTMRAIKGVRMGNVRKLKKNSIIAFSWVFAISNRLHIEVEDVVIRRFPYVCSYCGSCPCRCKKNKTTKRANLEVKNSLKPRNISQFQKMFSEIYPSESRTIEHSAIHLAEELGELSEAIQIYFAEHKNSQFARIEEEIADYISCFFGVANSTKLNVAEEVVKNYSNNCHACHRAPCQCSFSFMAKYKS